MADNLFPSAGVVPRSELIDAMAKRFSRVQQEAQSPAPPRQGVSPIPGQAQGRPVFPQPVGIFAADLMPGRRIGISQAGVMPGQRVGIHRFNPYPGAPQPVPAPPEEKGRPAGLFPEPPERFLKDPEFAAWWDQLKKLLQPLLSLQVPRRAGGPPIDLPGTLPPVESPGPPPAPGGPPGTPGIAQPDIVRVVTPQLTVLGR